MGLLELKPFFFLPRNFKKYWTKKPEESKPSNTPDETKPKRRGRGATDEDAEPKKKKARKEKPEKQEKGKKGK